MKTVDDVARWVEGRLCDLFRHEIDEGLVVDGERRRDPHAVDRKEEADMLAFKIACLDGAIDAAVEKRMREVEADLRRVLGKAADL